MLQNSGCKGRRFISPKYFILYVPAIIMVGHKTAQVPHGTLATSLLYYCYFEIIICYSLASAKTTSLSRISGFLIECKAMLSNTWLLYRWICTLQINLFRTKMSVIPSDASWFLNLSTLYLLNCGILHQLTSGKVCLAQNTNNYQLWKRHDLTWRIRFNQI